MRWLTASCGALWRITACPFAQSANWGIRPCFKKLLTGKARRGGEAQRRFWIWMKPARRQSSTVRLSKWRGIAFVNKLLLRTEAKRNGILDREPREL